MDPVPIELGRGSNAGRTGQVGLAHHLNAVLEEVKGQQGKSAYGVFAMNGQELFATLTEGGAIRAMLTVEGVCYICAGRVVFSLTELGIRTVVGGVGSDGWVTIAANRKTPNPQIAIVVDGLWYILEGGSLTQGTDPDLPPPLMVMEVDSYFVFLIRDGRWFIAGPNTADIDALDFAEAEASADKNVGGAVRGRTIIISGEKSTEFWDPTPDATFPFARTATNTFGCYAGPTMHNAVVMRGGTAIDTVIMCATDHDGEYMGVVALDGYQPVVISTPEVDALVRAETDRTQLSADYYTEDGHFFYVLSGANFTMAYDGRYGEWSQRKSSGSPRWKPGYSARLGSNLLLGRANENKIMRSSRNLMDEDGSTILWQAIPPTVNTWPKGFKVPAVWVDAITGVGLVTGADIDTDPRLHVDVSRDGGLGWGAQRHVSLGAAAQRMVRVKLRGLGRFDHNGMTLRFSCSARVTRGIQQVAIAATPLRG